MIEAVRSVCMEPPSSSLPYCIEPQQAPSGALTPEEMAAVAELRQLIEEENLPPQADPLLPAASAEAEAHKDDFTLLRFVKSRPEGIRQAFEMFRDAMLWRAEQQASKLFEELHPLGHPSPRLELARAHFYAGLGGVDKAGLPFFVERLGAADLAGFSREPGVLQVIMDAYVAYLETIFRTARSCSAATGTFVRVMILVDASQLSFSTLRHIGIIKNVSKIGPANYPEGSSRVLIVNAPKLFSAAWAFVSPLLPARTRAKISIFSASETAASLLELIDAAELPRFLGGEREESLVARADPVPSGLKLQ